MAIFTFKGQSVYANSGAGDMEVMIISFDMMTKKEIMQFCLREGDLPRCQEIQQEWREEAKKKNRQARQDGRRLVIHR